MPIRQLQLQCATCNAIQPHNQKTPNHVLHLLVSLFLIGLWIPIWILIAISNEPAVCVKCGNRRKVEGPAVAAPSGVAPAPVPGSVKPVSNVAILVGLLIGLAVLATIVWLNHYAV